MAAFLSELADIAPRWRRAMVFIHVPKTAGSALVRTARSAGWAVRDLDGFIRAREGCQHCGGSCRPRPVPASGRMAAPGSDLLVTVGHRSIDDGLAVADVLLDAGVPAGIVLAVRDPRSRLASYFRFFWRLALAGGVEDLVGRGSSRIRSLVLRRMLALTRGRFGRRGPDSEADRHRQRVDRLHAISGLSYARRLRGGLVIDAPKWFSDFERYGAGVDYWLDEILGTAGRARSLRDAGRLEIIRQEGLDQFSRARFGVPALRTNVSTDAPHAAVGHALASAAEDVARLARRDEPFAGLIAEAGG